MLQALVGTCALGCKRTPQMRDASAGGALVTSALKGSSSPAILSISFTVGAMIFFTSASTPSPTGPSHT